MPKPVKLDPRPPTDAAHPTPAQLRAGRALLGWSQVDLATAAGVSPRTLKTLELAPDLKPAPGRVATLLRLVRALADAGVSLHQDGGVVGVSRRLAANPAPPLVAGAGSREGKGR